MERKILYMFLMTVLCVFGLAILYRVNTCTVQRIPGAAIPINVQASLSGRGDDSWRCWTGGPCAGPAFTACCVNGFDCFCCEGSLSDITLNRSCMLNGDEEKCKCNGELPCYTTTTCEWVWLGGHQMCEPQYYSPRGGQSQACFQELSMCA